LVAVEVQRSARTFAGRCGSERGYLPVAAELERILWFSHQ
jgi:hypothetical protein